MRTVFLNHHFRSAVCSVFMLASVSAFLIPLNSFAGQRLYAQHRLTTSSYPVDGLNAAELKASMQERGPVAYDGMRHYAYTLWFIRIGRSRFEKLSRISSRRDLKCYVSVQLPRLYDPSLLTADLLAKWKSFISHMKEHESLHVKSVIRVCHVLITSMADQAQLQAFARRLDRRNKKLDQTSNYGKNSGVVLS